MKWIIKKHYITTYYLFFIVMMVVRWYDGLMLHQLGNNPILLSRLDPVIWILGATGLPSFFAGYYAGLGFDILIVILPFLILYLQHIKRDTRRIICLHSTAFIFYCLLLYCFPTLSLRKYLGLMLVPIAFIHRREDRYQSTLEALRYYVCFIFCSAAIWKITRGFAIDGDNFIQILKLQNVGTIIHYPDHIISVITSFLITHPLIAKGLLISGIGLQLSFLIGFFTKKLDRILAIGLLLFIVADFLIMRIEYWEFLIFSPLFYRPKHTTNDKIHA